MEETIKELKMALAGWIATAALHNVAVGSDFVRWAMNILAKDDETPAEHTRRAIELLGE